VAWILRFINYLGVIEFETSQLYDGV